MQKQLYIIGNVYYILVYIFKVIILLAKKFAYMTLAKMSNALLDSDDDKPLSSVGGKSRKNITISVNGNNNNDSASGANDSATASNTAGNGDELLIRRSSRQSSNQGSRQSSRQSSRQISPQPSIVNLQALRESTTTTVGSKIKIEVKKEDYDKSISAIISKSKDNTEDMDVDDDDEKPLSSLKIKTEDGSNPKKSPPKKIPPTITKTLAPNNDESDSDDDKPISTLRNRPKKEKSSTPPIPQKSSKTSINTSKLTSKSSSKPSIKSSSKSSVKASVLSDSEDDKPLSSIKRPKIEAKPSKSTSSSKSDKSKSVKKENGNKSTSASSSKKKSSSLNSTKKPRQETDKQRERRLAAEKEDAERYKWWEQDDAKKIEYEEGQRWKTLWHNTPLLAPAYTPLPKTVKFIYAGVRMDLTPDTEEVCGFYAAMFKTDYAAKATFVDNFFKDWKTFMTKAEKATIKDFNKCDFSEIVKYFDEQKEIKKSMTKEEKLVIKADKEKEIEEHGIAIVDGFKEKVGNFRIEPPGLFRGRGEHPKMGMVKRRVNAEDITINIGKGEKVPEPPAGHKWKEVINNDQVTWLATWTENVQGSIKYVMLNANSRMKGESDLKKYEKARELKKHIILIRKNYTEDLTSKRMDLRQRATAMYLIDRLALRAGNEKNTEEEADTVGCCSLRVEHVEANVEFELSFDFLGKDSIRYQNTVKVPEQIYKNIRIFKKGKQAEDSIFDRLTVPELNKHLQTLMEGLTAKVFRTYNASFTLQDELSKIDLSNANVNEKVLAYNRANRAVAILCNHQRAAPKSFDDQIKKMEDALKDMQKEMATLKKEKKELKGKDSNKIDKKIKVVKDRIHKKEIAMTDKEENKTVALGTSKINYMDPRITIAWAKKNEVDIAKVFTKAHRDKFQWALGVDPDFFW